jgi:hypothetical protein
VTNLKMSGKTGNNGDIDPDQLLMSSGKKSIGQGLDNLAISLDNGSELHNDLRISEIRAGDSSNKKANQADDIAEMEKLLKSGGAFGG